METSIDIHVHWNQAFQQCTGNVHQSQCNADIRHNLSRSGQYFISSKIELILNTIRVSVGSFFVNYWQDKILTPLGSFPQQFVLSPTFPDKTFLSPSFATGKKKNHFPRIFTEKTVTSLHTDILVHSRASQRRPPKGRSGCCRGVNHFNPNKG